MVINDEGQVAQQRTAHTFLTRKLQSYDNLSETEVQVLEHAIRGIRTFKAGQLLVTEGHHPSYSSLLVDGWAARSKALKDGERQITAIHIPGDFVDLHSLLLPTMDHDVVALSSCCIAMAPHTHLRSVTEEHPHLTRLLWLNTLVDSAVHRTWIVCMGKLSAPRHMAHLICELYVRLEAVNLAQNYEYRLPLTQPEIADTLGLSLVHVNRTVRELRENGLVNS